MLNGIMNAPYILKEIMLALRDLCREGKEHIIYINKLPLTEQDRELLLDLLGKGSVRVHINSKTQPMEYWETSVSGVWVGIIYDRDSKPTLEIIEVSYFPSLAKTYKEDIEESLKIFEERIRYTVGEILEKAQD